IAIYPASVVSEKGMEFNYLLGLGSSRLLCSNILGMCAGPFSWAKLGLADPGWGLYLIELLILSFFDRGAAAGRKCT
ncbi:hypothetical protein, partial [Klebsiella pneumoniae]|uniref:hypothetical protein n=1 Tax=Klebsiella pneumoniae TaxID=573 RepID=UPI001C5E7460